DPDVGSLTSRRESAQQRPARSGIDETTETVRKLLNLAPPAAEATSDTDPPQPLAHPCPCCGGRMIIIETFEAGCQPRHRPTAPLPPIRIHTSSAPAPHPPSVQA